MFTDTLMPSVCSPNGSGIRAALERIIEKAGEVEVTAGAVVAAVQAYSKINPWASGSTAANAGHPQGDLHH